MRPTFAAALLLSPMLLAASAVASQPSTDVPAPREFHRVTSAVAVSSRHGSVQLPSPRRYPAARATSSAAKVVLALNVDEKGQSAERPRPQIRQPGI